ncbi:MAG: DUF1295 domain-containing protein [Spirochaetes bacterium]|nr:DUF1295 domain-containing protein [Spirochaetota bacterium]
MYGVKKSSTGKKIFVLVLQTAFMLLAVLILMGKIKIPFTTVNLQDTFQFYRSLTLFIMIFITYLRMSFTLLVLLKREMGWEEALSVPFAFLLYYVGFSILSLFKKVPYNGVEYAGITLFILGAFINTTSEVLRNQWKKKSENRGKLYTKHFFALCRHPNYLGDLLWVSGFAFVTHNLYSAIIPLFLFSFFAFYNAPILEKYLAKKYSEQFYDYKKRVKMLIPFIF